MRREFIAAFLGSGFFALASSGCGTSEPSLSNEKIFGGSRVESGRWMSTVAVIDKYIGMKCTGTAVNPYLVITAAHCVVGFKATNTSIYVGDGREGGSVRGQYPAEAMLAHPRYSRYGSGNDIAFIKLKEPLPLPESAYVKILLESEEAKELLATGARARIVGFGGRNDGGSGVKFEVDTKVVPRISLTHDPKTEVAIGGGGFDSCQGDSGGPVFGQLANGEWRVYGVTSRGGACGSGGIYGLIHANICWVQSNAGVDLDLPEGYCDGDSTTETASNS